MGLDIYGYSQIEYYGEDASDEVRDSGSVTFFNSEDFLEYGDGLKDGYYTFKHKYHFHGGSYSGWGRRREELCRWVYDQDPEHVWKNKWLYNGKPFYELINFTDCDGAIGPLTSMKLLIDFQDHEARMLKDFTNVEVDGYDIKSLFKDMQIALKLASNNGCLVFA